MRRRLGAIVVAVGLLGGCLPSGSVATLPATLAIVESGGLSVAMQNGAPVPSFGWQPRPRIDLDGAWRFERAELDVALTMSDRASTLAAIEDEAAGRHSIGFDHRAWDRIDVPGTTNPPPDGQEGGAWYRRSFELPGDWAGSSVSLRFGSANYVADVWLNGTWLGYHEGGRTPFAFPVGDHVRPGETNVIAVRVHTIPVGSRADMVPWGLIDWWNYGGLTGPVWLEAAAPVHVVRADVRPHLDAVDLRILLTRDAVLAGEPALPPPAEGPASLVVRVLPATVTEENLLDPDPRALVTPGAEAIIVAEETFEIPAAGEVTAESLSIAFREADLWTPESPSLYVLHVATRWDDVAAGVGSGPPTDDYWTTFGIRHMAVDPDAPQVLLNGEPAFFRGVGLHGESLRFDAEGELIGGTPVQPPSEVLAELREAEDIGANFLRTGHEPADPMVLALADRLGFAVWEEIPLYHATPAVFGRVLGRGLPQQMLREMALRDFNHPSVLFHGFANESTGIDERTAALAELHRVDREIDGTRLTGQAAYGWMPSDPTHGPLDVAGYTSYHGVFYGDEPGPDTRRAVREARDSHPGKPIMILEFGRWADLPADETRQALIFEETYGVLEARRGDRPGGYVSAATWWTLRDFATQLGGITLEEFGLVRPDGSRRPVADAAAAAFGAEDEPPEEAVTEPEIVAPRVPPPATVGLWALAGYLAYGLAFAIGTMGIALVVLTRRGGRARSRLSR